MKRSIALVLLCMCALLLLAGCKTIQNNQDVKPVSSSTGSSAAVCSDHCLS